MPFVLRIIKEKDPSRTASSGKVTPLSRANRVVLFLIAFLFLSVTIPSSVSAASEGGSRVEGQGIGSKVVAIRFIDSRSVGDAGGASPLDARALVTRVLGDELVKDGFRISKEQGVPAPRFLVTIELKRFSLDESPLDIGMMREYTIEIELGIASAASGERLWRGRVSEWIVGDPDEGRRSVENMIPAALAFEIGDMIETGIKKAEGALAVSVKTPMDMERPIKAVKKSMPSPVVMKKVRKKEVRKEEVRKEVRKEKVRNEKPRKERASKPVDKGESAGFDLAEPPEAKKILLPGLAFGARIELAGETQESFNLDRKDREDLAVFEPMLSVALSYRPFDLISTYLNVELSYEMVDDREDKKQDRTELKVKQAYLTLENMVDGLYLRLGRQKIKDRREWFLDEEVDGARVFYSYSNYAVDLSVTEEHRNDLLNEKESPQVTNYAASFIYGITDDMELEGYFIARDDRTSVDYDPLFIGIGLYGEVRNVLDYWVLLAQVKGTDGAVDLNGYGLDLGITYGPDIFLRPSLTISYAYGSGDDDNSDDKDKNFRQTGLHGNSAKLGGLTRFSYYGVMFDPELSNMEIFTVGLDLRPTRTTSLDLLYHNYRQDKAYDEIRDSEVDEDPDGEHKGLGWEVDAVLAYKSDFNIKALLVGGYFVPGGAFTKDHDNAFFGKAELQYDFW